MEERNIISRIKRGDLTSLEKLVDFYQVRAVHAAYMIMYDRALAEDIAQMAFVKATERIHQFDERRPFAPWFFLSGARTYGNTIHIEYQTPDLGGHLNITQSR